MNILQIFKNITLNIIDFLSQFEDELVKTWNNPKNIKNSNYVITMDRINNIALIEKIFNHPNLNEQIKEWKELGIVEENFKVDKILDNDLTGKHLVKKYEHLPIDTKYFKDLELEILSQFEDLDNSLDGWLIKSENYQALNTMLPKFKEKVQTIYIDPPFNLDSSDRFLYRTNYKDANWATLLENRLRIAKEWLNEKGSIFVRCDYNGNWIVRCLLDEIFGKDNFRNEISVSRGNVPKGETGKMETGYDTLLFYAKGENNHFVCPKKKRNDVKWQKMHLPQERTTYELQVRYFSGIALLPPKGRHWALSQEKINEYIKLGKIRINEEKEYIDLNGNKVKGAPEILQNDYIRVDSDWTDISGYSSNWNFQTENAEILLKRVIESTSNEGDLVMDFFLGSGAATAVAHKLGRKWIGIEMGDHFYNVILPRMKKVLDYDKTGISKEIKKYKGGGFFKYFELEQYEETITKNL